MGISHLPLAYEYMCTQARPCKGTQTIHTLTEHMAAEGTDTRHRLLCLSDIGGKALPQQGEWLLGNVRAESVFLNNFTQNTCSAPSRGRWEDAGPSPIPLPAANPSGEAAPQKHSALLLCGWPSF